MEKSKYTESELDYYKSICERLWFKDTDEDLLVGFYHRNKEGKFLIDDLRTKSFQSLPDKNEDDEIGDINRISLDTPLNGCNVDQYYLFHWCVNTDSAGNHYVDLDRTFGIKSIDPKALISNLYDNWRNAGWDIASQMERNMKMISSQLTSSSEGTFIYELLQNANDYPTKDAEGNDVPVTVEFRLINDYLLYRHTGDYFSPRNVAAICKVHDGDKEHKKNAIGYKGIGFKTVFTGSDLVIIKTGDYQFRFDQKKSTKGAPWQVMPLWTEDSEIDPAVSRVMLQDSDKFRVQVAIHCLNKDKFVASDENTKIELLQSLFDDIRSIVFVPNVHEVRVYDGENKIIETHKDSANWLLSDSLKYEFTEEETKAINDEIVLSNTRIPEKYRDTKDTYVSFACKRDGSKLLPVEDAHIYCYLPTEVKFGFPFLMNTDMIPNGKRTDIEKNLKINLHIAYIAGRKMYSWIRSLIVSGEYDYASTFDLVPNFKECIAGTMDDNHKSLIKEIEKGFKYELCEGKNTDFIPVDENGNVKLYSISSIIRDTTTLSNSDILTDKEFLTISGLNGKLASKLLRGNKNFLALVDAYGCKELSFSKEQLFGLFYKSEFTEWLLKVDNNIKWLTFFCKKYRREIDTQRIFLCEGRPKLYKIGELYYDIDKDMTYLYHCKNSLPRLNRHCREQLENIEGLKDLKDLFKSFDRKNFVKNILFGQHKAAVFRLSHSKKASVDIIRYLAFVFSECDKTEEFISRDDFNGLWLYDINGSAIKSIKKQSEVSLQWQSRTVFFNSDLTQEMRSKEWFEDNWIAVINDEYLIEENGEQEETMSVFLKSFGAKELTEPIIVNEVLSTNWPRFSNCDHPSEREEELSKEYVDYIYNHRSLITNKKESGFESPRFGDVSLFFINFGEDGIKYDKVKSSDENNFSLVDEHVDYEWCNEEWFNELLGEYFHDKNEKDFKEFLSKYFGLYSLDDKSFLNIVLKHIDEVKSLTTDNQQLVLSVKSYNKSFWDFMGANMSYTDELSKTKLEGCPIITSKGKTGYISDRGKTFFYNNVLEEIVNSAWMPEDKVTMLDKMYSESDLTKRLLGYLGVLDYSNISFSEFFEKYIYGGNIPQDIDKISDELHFDLSLDTEEACRSFHIFLGNIKCYSKLTDIDIAILKRAPVYIKDKEEDESTTSCTNLFISLDTDFKPWEGYVKGLIPKINIIADEFVSEANKEYWVSKLGNKVLDKENFCQWLSSNKDDINSQIIDKEINIRFWRWIKDLSLSTKDKVNLLRDLTVLSFTDRDEENKETLRQNVKISDVLYMSDDYMGDSGIEGFAKKYNKKFISSIYVKEGDDITSWKRFWKAVGVKDDVKSVVRCIIDNELTTTRNKNLPGVIVEQYGKELTNEETWGQLAPKLIELQVMTTTGEDYVPIKDALRVIVDGYDQKEPYKMVKLPREISREYYKNENVRLLLNKIADYSDGLKTEHNEVVNKISDLNQWKQAKLNRYLILQKEFQNGSVNDLHKQFINELVTDKTTQYFCEAKSMKLYDQDLHLVEANALTISSAYHPKCDFQKFHIKKAYISDVYSHWGDANKFADMFRELIGHYNRIEDNDLHYLTNKEFSIYFWCHYVPESEKNAFFYQTEKKWIENKLLDNISCIPSDKGNMRRADELYTLDAPYISKIPNGKDKIVLHYIPKTRLLNELLENKSHKELTFSDCVDFLLNSKPKNEWRSNVLSWMLNSSDVNKASLLESYKENDKSLWMNGEGTASLLRGLMFIDPNKCQQAYVFKSNRNIIDNNFFAKDNALEIARDLFGMKIISDDTLVPEPERAENGNETEKVSADIKKKLLLVIAYRYSSQWTDKYQQLIASVNQMKFWLCQSISYGCYDLHIDNEGFYYDKDSKTFYYVDGWQDKKVYESFVRTLVDNLDLDLDLRECKAKLDENFKGEKIKKYIDENCSSLLSDDKFVSLVSQYWGNLNISKNKNQEDNYKEVEDNTEEEPVSNPPQHIGGDGIEVESNVSESNNDANVSKSSFASQRHQADWSDRDKMYRNTNHEHNLNYDGDAEGERENTGKVGKTKEPKVYPTIEERPSVSSGNNYSQRQRSNKYYYSESKPHNYTSEEIERLRSKGIMHVLKTMEPTATEVAVLNDILGEHMTAEAIADSNYLAQLRLYDNLKEKKLEPKESRDEFVKNADRHEHRLIGGKYIHKCSAYRGIMYISPSIWRKVSDDECVIVVYYGPQAYEYKYFNTKEELLNWIGEDDLVIKLTGSDKVNVIDELYSGILKDAKGTAYTLVRIASDERYNSVFAELNKDILDDVDEDENDYE